MTQTNILICAGFAPSARVLRAALRNLSTKKDIKVISGCAAMAGLAKYQEELRSLSPNDTLVVDGCEGYCGLQSLMAFGVMPVKSILLDRCLSVDEKSIKRAENQILKAIEEMGR